MIKKIVFFQIAIHAFLSFYIINFSSPRFGTNDDEFFAALTSGRYTGTPESFTHLSTASPYWIFGKILQTLNVINDSVAWYPYTLLTVVVISMALISYLILKNIKYYNYLFLVFLNMIQFNFLIWFIPNLTYTAAAIWPAIAAVIGFLLFYVSEFKRKIYFQVSAYASLFFLAMSIRQESALLVAAMLSPLLLNKNTFTLSKLQHRSKVTSVFALTVLALFALNNIIEKTIVSNDKNWQEYLLFEEYRYAIQDNLLEDQLAANLDQFGWTQEEYILFDSYNFGDQKTFNSDKLARVVENEETRLLEIDKFFNVNNFNSLEIIYEKYRYFFFFSILILLIIFYLFKKVPSAPIIFTFIVHLSIMNFIYSYLRFPDRVTFSISLLISLIPILYLSIIQQELRQSNALTKFFLPISVTFSLLIFTPPTIQYIKQANTNIYEIFWLEQKTLIEKLDPNFIYIGNASQFRSFWANPYLNPEAFTLTNSSPMGWYTPSPHWKTRNELLGLKMSSTYEEIVLNQNVIWVSDELTRVALITHLEKQNNWELESITLASQEFLGNKYDYTSIKLRGGSSVG